MRPVGEDMKTVKLKTVKLIDPSMCLSCRFAKTADVEYDDGTIRRSLRCLSEWCDNHGEIDYDLVPLKVMGEENYD